MVYSDHPDYSTKIPPSLDLREKCAIVTGGTRGIGRQIALTLASRGVNVAITYTSASSKPAAEEVVQKIENLGRRSCAIQYDLSNPDCGIKIVNSALKELQTNHLDILVNNAAIANPGGPRPSTESYTAEEFDSLFHVNVRAPILLMQAVVPHFNPAGSNRIINLSSIQSRLCPPNFMLYAATKAALDSLTRIWAKELATPYKCTVNGVLVGATDTPDAPASEARVRVVASMTTAEPRLGTMDDIADVVTFIASDASRWINGDTISCNGGIIIE